MSARTNALLSRAETGKMPASIVPLLPVGTARVLVRERIDCERVQSIMDRMNYIRGAGNQGQCVSN